MGQTFNAVVSRVNDTQVDASWFNVLKNAGMNLEAFLGLGFITETNFALANNQAGVADITGLIIDHTVYTSAYVLFEVRRKTATNESISVGKIAMFYRAASSTWDIMPEKNGDDDGITFSITAAGQVQYTSSNITGASYVGTIKFKAFSFAI